MILPTGGLILLYEKSTMKLLTVVRFSGRNVDKV